MQAAQLAQMASTELFQALYFTSHSDSERCIVNAVIISLRPNGVLVFVPRYRDWMVPSSNSHIIYGSSHVTTIYGSQVIAIYGSSHVQAIYGSRVIAIYSSSHVTAIYGSRVITIYGSSHLTAI